MAVNAVNLHFDYSLHLEMGAKVAISSDIVRYVLAFDGDVLGAYVRDIRIANIRAVDSLCIRIDPVYLLPFINILGLDYKINKITGDGKYTQLYELAGLRLEVIPLKRFDFRALPCDFDCNIMAFNNECFYIWKIYPIMRPIIDKTLWLSERIRERKFCLIHKNYTEKSCAEIVEEAVNLVSNGWTMDSEILKESSWTVNKWKSIPLERKLRCTECAICQEEFTGDDIVFSTCCKHNFHWTCKNSQLGLKTWVKSEDNHTCPQCRSVML